MMPSLSAAEREVGQLIMTGFAGTLPTPQLLAEVRGGEIGGVLLFGENISSRLPQAISQLQRAARLGGHSPLLIATDQEGGPIRRFPEGPPVPSTRAIRSPAEAYRQGLETGRFLAAHGVNVDFAPIADVTGSQDFELAQERGFNGTPSEVALLVEAFVRGLQTAGVAATAKHFPGIGTLPVDTDYKLQKVAGSVGELEARALPFRRAIKAGLRLVMMANAIYPSLDPRWPATMSPSIQQGLLRRRFGFRGVIVTDALNGPPESPGSLAERAVHAVEAGADIVLFDAEEDGPLIYRALVRALRDHQLSPATVEAAFATVSALKRWVAP